MCFLHINSPEKIVFVIFKKHLEFGLCLIKYISDFPKGDKI